MSERQNDGQGTLNPLKALHNGIFLIRNNSRLIFHLRLSWFLILFVLLWPIPIYILAFMMLMGCSAWILKSNGDLWNPIYELRRIRQSNHQQNYNRQVQPINQERSYNHD